MLSHRVYVYEQLYSGIIKTLFFKSCNNWDLLLLLTISKGYGYKYQDNQHGVYDYYFSQYPGMKQFYVGENYNREECGKKYQQRNHTPECCRSEGYAARIPTNVIPHPLVFLADFRDGHCRQWRVTHSVTFSCPHRSA